jgi:hypothetical protein
LWWAAPPVTVALSHGQTRAKLLKFFGLSPEQAKGETYLNTRSISEQAQCGENAIRGERPLLESFQFRR